MANGYVRQSAAQIAAGQAVASTPVNNEFNALQSAFNISSGHNHDGTTTGCGPQLGTIALSSLTAVSAGIVAATGSNTFVARTITGTADKITVTNGTGVSGNPTLTISSTYIGQNTITTLGTITTGVWNGTILDPTYGGTGINNGSSTITTSANVSITGLFTTSGAFSTTGAFTTAAAFTTSGANSLTLTTTAPTNITLPTTGTLVTTAVTTLSSLVSIGTITTGIWNATIISPTYGGTGVNNGSSTITLAANFVTSGANSLTLTTTGSTNVTLPTSGTLVNTAVTTLSNLVSVGTITTGVWNASIIGLAYGGTAANLTASNGGIVYSTASAMAILAGTATAGQVLRSGSSTAPTWSTATYPSTTTVNRLLYSSSANVISDLATANSSILVTDGSGVPSLSTTIPNGVSATTQAAQNNSTAVATTAYVNAAAKLGTWQYNSFTAGISYLASTDGFVVAYAANSGAANPILDGYTDSSNPPTTLIIRSSMNYVGGVFPSVTFPVKRGEYWSVVQTSCTTPNISFLPLGN